MKIKFADIYRWVRRKWEGGDWHCNAPVRNKMMAGSLYSPLQ